MSPDDPSPTPPPPVVPPQSPVAQPPPAITPPPGIFLEPLASPYVSAHTDLSAIPLALPVTLAHAASPAKPTSAGGFDLLIGVALALGAELFLGMLAVLPAMLSGVNVAAVGTDIFSPLMILFTALSSGLFAAGVAWYFTCRRHHLSFRSGMAIRGAGIGQILFSVGLGVSGAIAGLVCLSGKESGNSLMSQLVSTREGLLVISALALVLPPLEEFYYRGFIFPIIRKYLGPGWAILLVTLWFGGAHAIQLAGDWAALPIVICMGAIWTVQRHLTKSLVPSIITHWIYNACLTIPGLFFQ